MAHGLTYQAEGSRGTRLSGAAVVVALHVIVLAALWQLEPVRSALTSAVPLMVKLVETPRVQPETPPKPLPQKPRVQRQAPRVAPQPVLAAAPEAPTPQAVAPAPPAPPAPVEAPPAPPVAAPAPVAPPPAPAPVAITPPRFNADYLQNPAPAYPALSRRMGEEGKVILRVHVTERGLADEVQIRTSSGSERLDKAAQEAVRQWRFVPARRGDTPVAEWVAVPISFSLRS